MEETEVKRKYNAMQRDRALLEVEELVISAERRNGPHRPRVSDGSSASAACRKASGCEPRKKEPRKKELVKQAEGPRQWPVSPWNWDESTCRK